MIKDPPLLTMRRAFERPTALEIAGFANVPTGHAVDALGGRGALDYRIKPLAPPSPVIAALPTTSLSSPLWPRRGQVMFSSPPPTASPAHR